MTRTQHPLLVALLAVVVIAVVLAVGASPAWAPGAVGPVAFFFNVALAGGPSSFATAFELATDEKREHTLSVTMGISTSSAALMSLNVGQQFENAVLQIIDQTGMLVSTIRLSPARVAEVKSTGEATALVLSLVVSGKNLAVSFP